MLDALPVETKSGLKEYGDRMTTALAILALAKARHGCGSDRSNGSTIKHASAKPATSRLRHFTLTHANPAAVNNASVAVDGAT